MPAAPICLRNPDQIGEPPLFSNPPSRIFIISLPIWNRRDSFEAGMQYLEAWIRDDQWGRDWYAGSGFRLVDSYLQVYVEGEKDLKALPKAKFHSCIPYRCLPITPVRIKLIS